MSTLRLTITIHGDSITVPTSTPVAQLIRFCRVNKFTWSTAPETGSHGPMKRGSARVGSWSIESEER